MSADGSFHPAVFAPEGFGGVSSLLGRAQPGPGLVAVNPTSDAGGLEPLTFTREESRLRRLVKAVRWDCRVHDAQRDKATYPAMFTLTCRKGRKPDDRAIVNFVKNVRDWCRRKLDAKSFRYVWVAELQAARAASGDPGAIHYHVVFWLPMELRNRGLSMAARNSKFKASGVLPKPDKKGWWKFGSTERDWVRTNVARYLSKYLTKEGIPRGMRGFSSGGFDATERTERSHWMLPKWMRDQCTPADRAKRAEGGGFVTLDGTRYASPWFVMWSGRTVRVVRRTVENIRALRAYVDGCVSSFLDGEGRSRLPVGLVYLGGLPGPDVPF